LWTTVVRIKHLLSSVFEGKKAGCDLDAFALGTYADKIADVAVSGNHIKFTRNGRFGVQYWEGTLKREHGVLKIVDGRWTKEPGVSGSFIAEKKAR